MTTKNDSVYNTIIDSTTARVGDDSTNKPNGVSSSFSREVNILPKVSINGKSYEVTEIGEDSLNGATKITKINIPSTIKTLKENCFTSLSLVKSITTPASVTTVESWFISNMGPENITFLGEKEPKMINTAGKGYISASFKGKVNVPLEYKPWKDTFLLREINRMKLIDPTAKKRKTFNIRRKNVFLGFLLYLTILVDK